MAWLRKNMKFVFFLTIVLISWSPFFIAAWDKGEPHEHIDAPEVNDVIRANNLALETALNAYNYFATGGSQTGRPRQGSARVYFQDSAPTARLDGDYLDSTDLGCIWIDPNSSPDNQFNILTAADGAGNETWTPISDEIIAVLLGAERTFAEIITFSKSPVFTLGLVGNNSYLQSRNKAGDGNVNLIKVDVNDVPVIPDGTETATDAAPLSDKDISNKKYVDDQLSSQVGAARLQYDGSTVFNTTLTSADTWQDLDLSSIVGENRALCFFEVKASAAVHYAMKPKGYGSSTFDDHVGDGGRGSAQHYAGGGDEYSYLECSTDDAGVLQHGASTTSSTMTIKLIHYLTVE